MAGRGNPSAASFDIRSVLESFARSGDAAGYERPLVERLVDGRGRDPFLVLCSTLLSLRTKDETTGPAQERLFALADTPERMVATAEEEIARAIYPVGFYRRKAETLREVSALLLDRHGGKVPDTLDELLALPGVGRKTANLTLTAGFGKPGICVDTHVHRIMNRLGYVATATPDETEFALRGKLPADLWIPVNEILVRWGQKVCGPLSPRCSACPAERACPKIGVVRRR